MNVKIITVSYLNPLEQEAMGELEAAIADLHGILQELGEAISL
jgi:hypothetical protein